MRIRTQKKAWVAITTVIILGIVMSVIVFAYYKPYSTSEVLGKQQAAIMESYSIGEQARRYTQDAANMAAKQAIYKLASQGGTAKYSDGCGEVNGYALWTSGCEPSSEEIQSNFEELFTYNFDVYLRQFKLPVYKEEKSILPTLDSEKEPEYSLYDIVEYNFKIDTDGGIIIIEGLPTQNTITYFEEIYKINENTGEQTSDVEDVVEITAEYESAIKISSEKYMFEYILDPYFRTEVDFDLTEEFRKAKSSASEAGSSGDYTLYESDTGANWPVGIGSTVKKENIKIKYAK